MLPRIVAVVAFLLGIQISNSMDQGLTNLHVLMPTIEHLEVLKQGREAWNRWRQENPQITPDLSGLDSLRDFTEEQEAHFRSLGERSKDSSDLVFPNRVNFSNTRFDSSRLYGLSFEGSDLRGASFADVDLTYGSLLAANLENAYLRNTILFNTNLKRANLRGAVLVSACFVLAHLEGADLSQTTMNQITFANVDLSKVKGLDTVNHAGPSSVGIDTIYYSEGHIPEKFLRGAGIPDTFIVYAQSLIGKAIEFYSCFISHSSRDNTFAERLYADLQNKGVRCWFAPKDLKIGERIRTGIDESIRLHDKLLLVLSKTSINSQWVEQEVETALARERELNRTVLFPIRIDNFVMKIESGWPALVKHSRNIGDFTQWKNHDVYQKSFNRLLHDLRASELTAE